MFERSKPQINVDAFLVWANGQPGRNELIAGRPGALRQEWVGTTRTKAAVGAALTAAVEHVSGPCESFADGMMVLTDAFNAVQPYAVIRCGAPLPWGATLVSDPIVIVEVVHAHFAGGYDTMGKMIGYFDLPSVQHYLIVDGDSRTITHFQRCTDYFQGRFLTAGPLRLDPPGLDLGVEDLLGPDDGAG